MAERMSDKAVRARLRDSTLGDVGDGDDNVPTKRRTPEFLIGLLLVIGGAVGGLALFQGANSRAVVVGTARQLSRGTIITREDLTALEVGQVPNESVIGAADAGDLLGRRLLVDLPAGVPVPGFVTTDVPLLAASEALVPIALDNGAVPDGLTSGDTVRVVISFPNSGDDAPRPEMLPEVMEVHSVVAPDDLGNEVYVTVRTSTEMAIDLARADRIQVIKVGAS